MKLLASLMIAALCSAALTSAAAAQKAPAKGWVGVSLIQRGAGDNASGVTLEYPIIASVDPGSPAQTAGLVAGDTILAYNDVDAHSNPLGVERLLSPGTKIVFRVRRNGDRSIALTVARRPTASAARRSVRIDVNQVATLPSMEAFGPVSFAHPIDRSGVTPVAGAQLVTMTEALSSALGVGHTGILVLDVANDSPAATAGLEPGDVIVSADATDTTTPLQLVQAMRATKSHSVALDVLRKGKSQKLTVSW